MQINAKKPAKNAKNYAVALQVCLLCIYMHYMQKKMQKKCNACLT